MGESSLRSAIRFPLQLLAASGCILLAFLPLFTSGFDRLSGDLGDNRLYLVLLEHWRAVFHGNASWADPNFFFPLHHVLGFSDAVALFLPPYLLLRELGADRYIAYECCLILFRLAGFAGMHLLLRSVCAFPRSVAVFGASLFALSNVYGASLGHGQLSTVALTPFLACFVAFSIRYKDRRLVSLAFVGAAATLYGALLLTSYYIAFFCMLFAATSLLLHFSIPFLRQPSRSLRSAFTSVKIASAHLLVALACLLPWLCLFAALYFPVIRQRGTRPFWEVEMQTLAPSQIINPGPANLVWGDLIKAMPSVFQLNVPRETGRGWPLVTFTAFVLFGMSFLRKGGWPATLTAATLLLAFAATTIHGFYPWRVVFHLVPGASGIRVPGRINLLLNGVVVILLADGLRRKLCDPTHSKDWFRTLKLWALCVVILLEQLNFGSFPGFSRHEEASVFGAVPIPPPQCRAFYVASSTRPSADWRSIDAMLVARQWGIPTLNGYSGIIPPGGGCPNDEEQCRRVLQEWARQNNATEGLCELDLRNGEWIALGTIP